MFMFSVWFRMPVCDRHKTRPCTLFRVLFFRSLAFPPSSSNRTRYDTDLPFLFHRSTLHLHPPPPSPSHHPLRHLLHPNPHCPNRNPSPSSPAPSTSPASSSPSSPWNSSCTTCTSSPSRTSARLAGTVSVRWRWWAFGIWFLFG